MKEERGQFTASVLFLCVGIMFCVPVGSSLAEEEPAESHQKSWQAPPEAKEMKNPVPADADSLSLGKDLYDEHCLMCHGEKGMGDGAMADTLSRPPGNLADPQVMGELTDGELFWRISKGDDLMPSFETEKPLPEEDRWHIINYVRTLANSAQ